MAVHGHFSPLGQITFTTHTDVTLRTKKDEIRQPLVKEGLPPAVMAGVSVLEALFSQALGKLGQGAQFYVFDGTGIDSCQEGGFWVSYADEEYNYDTPIPGCQ